MRPDYCPLNIPLPPLSDDAVVEILDFLQAIALRFEVLYGGEIHRYYEQHSCHNIIEPDLPELTEPPF